MSAFHEIPIHLRIKDSRPLFSFERVGPVPQIVAFRNILVHAYDNIDHEIVWHVIQNELPRLVATVETLMQRPRSDPQEPSRD